MGKRGRVVAFAVGLAALLAVAGLLMIERPVAARQPVEPSTSMTPAPVTPAPVTPAPVTPAPVTPAPVTQSPAAQAPAMPPPASEVLWSPRYDFALEVDGKASPEACFYQERNSRRIMITAPDLESVCILNQDGKQVTPVDRSRMTLEADGEMARLLPGAETGGPGSPYTIDQSSVVFYMGSNRLKILMKQPLVGTASAAEIFRHSPLYRKGMQEYRPDAADVAFLRSYPGTIEIEVFFGTWCPHCKVLVPKFMKAMEDAANSRLVVSYHGVPTGFDGYGPAHSKAVKGIPTFIFWKTGREVGRIPGDPGSDTIEHAVAEILRGIKD